MEDFEESEVTNVPLCAGAIFNLLYAVRNRNTVENASMMYERFAKILYPEYVNRYNRPDISHFRSCDAKNKNPLPFGDPTRVNAFHEAVRENYDTLLNRADKFIRSSLNLIDQNDMKWLAGALVELIIEDEKITDDVVFSIDRDGKDKEYIRHIENVLLQGLLVGVIDYVARNVPDNSAGNETVPCWLARIGNTNEVARERVSTYRHRLNVTTDIPASVCRAEDEAFYPEQETYFNKALDEYGNAKTFFYKDERRPLDSFYVCSDVSVRFKGRASRYGERERIPNSTIAKLNILSKQIVITGTGGVGKSMMMRHLMVDAINNRAKYRQFPIFITLRDYEVYGGGDFEGIFRLLLKEINLRRGSISRANLEKMLDEGKVVLLLDGLDEVAPDRLEAFSKELNDFVSRYSESQFIMSSRQMSEFGEYDRFRVIDLCPLTKGQAIELVRKLEYREDEPEFKEEFIRRLDKELYGKHQDFAQIPLLLNIMLITYATYDNIPSKIHVFYERAFRALAEQHDAGKRNGFHRVMKSGLETDDLEKLIGEFCYLTYVENKYEFSKSEFSSFFSRMKIRKKINKEVSADNFLHDMELCLCMIYHEGDTYFYSHRSFQEYFTALYIAGKGERRFKELGEEYNTNRHGGGDMMFEMLYDMNTERVTEGMIFPALRRIFETEEGENGYHKFLKMIYKRLPATDYGGLRQGRVLIGGVGENIYEECFEMAVGTFTTDILRKYIKYTVVPFHEEFISYAVYEDNSGDRLIRKFIPDNRMSGNAVAKEVTENCRFVGHEMIIDMNYVMDNQEKYHDIIEALEKDDCAYKWEYETMKRYYDNLVEELEED